VSGLEALVLGIIQGLTEFLPVSSKGHLVMGETLLGIHLESVTFEALVHVATLAAVLVVLRSRLWQVLRERDVSYILKMAIACAPVGMAGFLFKDRIETIFHDPVLTGVGLLFTGCVLFGLRFAPRGELPVPTYRGALIIGLAQTLALLPGVSRSGMTISAALVMGVAGPGAAEFSFLVALPVIAAVGLLQALDMQGIEANLSAASLVIGFSAAFVFGIIAIRLVYRLLTNYRFGDFAFYCWPAGLLFLLYLAARGG
jgi:undecaprenyl-diphosphatase